MLRSIITPQRFAVVAFAILWILLRWQLAQAQPPPVDPACQLPTVEYLGEGQGLYPKPAGVDHLIVKKFHPFRFELVQTDYQSTKGNPPPERVWACTGNCILPAVFHDAVDLGYQDAGSVFRFRVIDDDTDARYNTLRAGSPITPTFTYTIMQQGMVQSVIYTTTMGAHWWLYAEDSIGLVQPCVNPPDATPTATPVDQTPPTATPTATASPTESPTATNTALPGDTPTATPSATPEPSISPTASPTLTPTTQPGDTPTNTPPPPVASPTATPTGSATGTPPPDATLTPTSTNTPVAITLTPTATLKPTNLDPIGEPGQNNLYLPIIVK